MRRMMMIGMLVGAMLAIGSPWGGDAFLSASSYPGPHRPA